MIVYIIIYIGVPEEWNTIALTSVAVLDYTLLNAQSWMKNAQGWVNNAQGWMNNAQGWVKNAQDKAEAWLNWLKIQLHINNTAASTKKKTRRHKKKHCNKKRVRFSEVNQYHEYKPWGGEVNTNLTTNFNFNSSNINSNANTNSNANGNLNLNVPSWQLTPQQQLQQHLWKQYQAQMKASSGTKANSGMIDNRHLIVKDE
jgi:hypothetical protein